MLLWYALIVVALMALTLCVDSVAATSLFCQAKPSFLFFVHTHVITTISELAMDSASRKPRVAPPLRLDLLVPRKPDLDKLTTKHILSPGQPDHPPAIFSLPPDLFCSIFVQYLNLADLRSMARVNKRFNSLATSFLTHLICPDVSIRLTDIGRFDPVARHFTVDLSRHTQNHITFRPQSSSPSIHLCTGSEASFVVSLSLPDEPAVILSTVHEFTAGRGGELESPFALVYDKAGNVNVKISGIIRGVFVKAQSMLGRRIGETSIKVMRITSVDVRCWDVLQTALMRQGYGRLKDLDCKVFQ